MLNCQIAYRLIDTYENSYFIAEEAVTLRIIKNIFHNVINFADWEDSILKLHTNGANTCQLQFSSPRGNLDDEFKENSTGLHYNIMVSNNTFVLPGYLIKFDSDLGLDRNCTWLAKTSFKTTKSHHAAEQFINISNSAIMQHSDTNVIPSKICQCFINDSFTCNIRQLGPVYPGQTLKVNLTIPTLASSNALALMTVRILSNSEKACLIDNLAETYQLRNNHSCQEYYYTIKYHTFETCELYLRTQQHDTEMFFVQLIPCPPGFALQSNACTCDPLLQFKGMEIKECDLNSGTITRPADSWILSINNTTNEPNCSNHISLHCPYDYCLPYASQHNL